MLLGVMTRSLRPTKFILSDDTKGCRLLITVIPDETKLLWWFEFTLEYTYRAC